MWYQEVERKEEEEKEEEKDKQWASTLSLEGEQKVSAVKGVDTKGSPHEKKMFSFGHCSKRGGVTPARIF